MHRLAVLTFWGVAFASVGLAQPRILGLQNNYSYLVPDTPNYAIAQGSIVVIYGAEMAPAGLLQQGFDPALNRNLGGVSIKIASGGVTTEAVPYYVSPGQIAAILPSATPTGPATMTVTYNGRTSAPFAFRVVRGAFGILTLGGNGLGTAAVFDLNFNYISHVDSAEPGQVVYFWGTGQGPDPNDETRLIAAPRSLDELPFEFYIGGQRARVLYHGRSTFPGLDQIAVEIPQGVSGCYVAAYAKTGDFISNFVSIPVATSGKACTDWFATATDTERLLGSGRATVDLAWLYLVRFIMHTPAGGPTPALTVIQDSATAQFTRYEPFHASNWGAVGGFSFPGCIVTAWRTQQPFTSPLVKSLDAGPNFQLTLPGGGSRTLDRLGGNYAFSVNDATPGAQLIVPANGGTFRYRAPGGADVGMVDANIDVDNSFVWNEFLTTPLVRRDQPTTLTWRGGAPAGFVLIQGFTFTGANAELSTSLGCTVPATDGRFTIPRDVLASMFPSVDLGVGPTGTLSVSHFTFPARFQAQGIDQGSISWETSYVLRTVYR